MKHSIPINGEALEDMTGTQAGCVTKYFVALSQLFAHLPFEGINQATEILVCAYRQSRAVFLFGNGGSAALASHLACDLGKGTVLNGNRRFRVLSLTDNVPLLTAWANDLHYEHIFAEQLRHFIQPGDVAFAISGSGNSPNVLRGLEATRQAGAFSILLTGFQGGKASPLADLPIIVPSEDMQHIEDMHLVISHAIFRSVRDAISAMSVTDGP